MATKKTTKPAAEKAAAGAAKAADKKKTVKGKAAEVEVEPAAVPDEDDTPLIPEADVEAAVAESVEEELAMEAEAERDAEAEGAALISMGISQDELDVEALLSEAGAQLTEEEIREGEYDETEDIASHLSGEAEQESEAEEEGTEEKTAPDSEEMADRMEAKITNVVEGAVEGAGRRADDHRIIMRQFISSTRQNMDEPSADERISEFADIRQAFSNGMELTGMLLSAGPRIRFNDKFPLNNENLKKSIMASVMFGSFEVLIPYEEFVFDLPPMRVTNPNRVMSAMLNRIMRCRKNNNEIDFVVTNMDNDGGIIIGSRRKACRQIALFNYFGKDRHGKTVRAPFITVGSKHQAKIIQVLERGIVVELAGVQTVVPITEIEYTYTTPETIKEKYGTRKHVYVRVLQITELPENDDRVARIRVSIKQAKQNPLDTLFNSIQIGTRVEGRVVLLYDAGFMADVGNGVWVYSPFSARNMGVQEGDYASLIITDKRTGADGVRRIVARTTLIEKEIPIF